MRSAVTAGMWFAIARHIENSQPFLAIYCEALGWEQHQEHPWKS